MKQVTLTVVVGYTEETAGRDDELLEKIVEAVEHLNKTQIGYTIRVTDSSIKPAKKGDQK